MPSAKKKVESQLGKAKLDIEKKLVPEGEGITRHLILPAQGQTAEWILQEMGKMDLEFEKNTNWKDGTLSGAVYRTPPSSYSVTCYFFQVSG